MSTEKIYSKGSIDTLFKLYNRMPNIVLARLIDKVHTDINAPSALRNELAPCQYVTINSTNIKSSWDDDVVESEPCVDYLFYCDEIPLNKDLRIWAADSIYRGKTSMTSFLAKYTGEDGTFIPILTYNTLDEYVNDLPNLKHKLKREYKCTSVGAAIFLDDKELLNMASVYYKDVEHFRISKYMFGDKTFTIPKDMLSDITGVDGSIAKAINIDDYARTQDIKFHYSELTKLKGNISIILVDSEPSDNIDIDFEVLN